MRNPFHRKKLHLAIMSVTTEKTEPVDDLDHNWVTRESTLLVQFS